MAFSDGVTEARSSAGVEFGDARLARLARGVEGLSASDVCLAVLDEVRMFAGGTPQADDLTVVAAHVQAGRS